MGKLYRSKARAAATDDDIPTEQLPTFDGTQLNMGIWLRILLNCMHLLPPDKAVRAFN